MLLLLRNGKKKKKNELALPVADSLFPSVQTWHDRGAPLLIADVQISACNQSWIQLKLFISCSPIVINCNTNQWLMTSFINAASIIIITRIHVRVISWASQGMDIQCSCTSWKSLETSLLNLLNFRPWSSGESVLGHQKSSKFLEIHFTVVN